MYHLHFSILPPIPRPRSRLRRRHLHGLEPHILHRMPYSILDITPSPSPTPSDRQQPCLHNHRPSPRPYSVPGSTQTWPSHRPFFIPPDSPHPHFPSSGCGRFPNRYQSSPQPFASACKSSASTDMEAGQRAEVIPILPQTRPRLLPVPDEKSKQSSNALPNPRNHSRGMRKSARCRNSESSPCFQLSCRAARLRRMRIPIRDG